MHLIHLFAVCLQKKITTNENIFTKTEISVRICSDYSIIFFNSILKIMEEKKPVGRPAITGGVRKSLVATKEEWKQLMDQLKSIRETAKKQ